MRKAGNPGRDAEVFRARVSRGTVATFAQIAEQLGYFWKDRPQPGKVLEAIARHPEAIAAILKEFEKGR